MAFEEEKAKKLADLIKEEIQKEFQNIHLTKNLMDTINIYKSGDKWIVDIPAQKYDFKTYFETGAIVPYKLGGSYAEKVNEKGGFSKTHKNYVERCINKAIQRWKAYYQINVKVSENNVKK